MTVCIAAICENGLEPNSQKIILCADRQISTTITTFESGMPKIIPITDYCYVMISSNDSARTHRIIRSASLQIDNKKMKIENIVKIFSDKFQELFKEEREKQVLEPYGLNYKEFSDKSKNMNQALLRDISDSLLGFRTSSSSIIIAGFDPSENMFPNLYVMDEKGDYSFENGSGFAVVGSGSYLAFPEMTRHEPPYHASIGFSDALIRVYRAKKVAQRVGGVGASTNLAVLSVVNGESSLWEVTPSEIEDSKKSLEILDRTIQEVQDKEKEILNESIENLNKIFVKEIAKVDDVKPELPILPPEKSFSPEI